MNSKQRRKIQRKFKHVVYFGVPNDKTGLLTRINSMNEWCIHRYGYHNYIYKWVNWTIGPSFAFRTESDMIEFKLACI